MQVHWKKIEACPLCLSKVPAKLTGYRQHTKQGLFPERDYRDAAQVYTCRACGLIYNNPQAMIDRNSIEHDDSLFRFTHMDANAIKAGEIFTDITGYLAKHADFKGRPRALDIGFGIGRVTYKLKQEGYDVKGIEVNPQLFEYAINHGFIDKEDAMLIDFENFRAEGERFDFIFLEPLTHLPNPNEAILRTLQWLKPGGFLHLEVNNSRWLYSRLLNLFYRLSFKKTVLNTSPCRSPYRACEYPIHAFKVFCDMYGLELHNAGTHPCNTGLRHKILDRAMQWFMRTFDMGEQTTVLIRKPG